MAGGYPNDLTTIRWKTFGVGHVREEDRCARFFFGVVGKILMAKGLRARGREIAGQNLEPQGLTAKIFWNKGLALCAEPLRGSLAENGLEELSRIHPSLRFPESSVKVVRHRSGKFFCGRLWKRLVSLRERYGRRLVVSRKARPRVRSAQKCKNLRQQRRRDCFHGRECCRGAGRSPIRSVEQSADCLPLFRKERV